MKELTQEIVRELLHYEPDTGKLYWKERDAKWFKDGYRTAQGNANNWNSQFAGKELFLISSKNKQTAIDARKQAEIKYGYHKNHGRKKA